MSTDFDIANTSHNGTQDSVKPVVPVSRLSLPPRPPLRRDQSAPASQQVLSAPPLPPSYPSQQQHFNNETVNNTDPLSFGQLKRLVNDMPTAEAAPYAFTYADTASFREELEEWFTYGKDEQTMLLTTWTSFTKVWEAFQAALVEERSAYEEASVSWVEANDSTRANFIKSLAKGLRQHDALERMQYLEALTYVGLGSWYETAGIEVGKNYQPTFTDPGEGCSSQDGSCSVRAQSQLNWIKMNVKTITSCGTVQPVMDLLVDLCQQESFSKSNEVEASQVSEELFKRQQWCCFTFIYIILAAAAPREGEISQLAEQQIKELKPNLLLHMAEIVSRFRWDDSVTLPLNKVLLLTWKAILIQFGGLADVDRVKLHLGNNSSKGENTGGDHVLTASPLDYHIFRQEISSKYPAYNPPPPLLPLEPDNNSILPPLHKTSHQGSHNSGLGNLNSDGTSILHQPVHIATPAPSPPPSPAGPGGKGGKKQNYQTNQLFPFLYPPLDEASNNLGGKGTTNLQDTLVTRRWEGSDIPSSILEAAELFAMRMKVTRPMKQLWEERINFMKYERGWDGTADCTVENIEMKKDVEHEANNKDVPSNDRDAMNRLSAVEDFYRNSLPYMQSIVIVLLKVILSTVTASMAQNSGASGVQYEAQFQDTQVPNNSENSDGSFETDRAHTNTQDMPVEVADVLRSQEITVKSVSGILILLLKWFKLSHVLKFEYLTQLLLDSNYIPLILKLLQGQELDQVVSIRCDKDELSIFQFCASHSRHSSQANEHDQDESTNVEDLNDAAPPPVVKMREYGTGLEEDDNGQRRTHPPVVDELGVPTCSLPLEPITTFNWRIFFSSINILRIMQKICKNKGHRNLLLVQYKSYQYLKKALKVPQPELRLYTLKLFKNQVPYWGRKLRQSNMRVITAVYLHCRPELRDDWLAGSDVDAEVEEALPLEQALRSITYWHNLKRYADKIGAGQSILGKEQDFFVRELQKMDWEEDNMASKEADVGWEGPIQLNAW